MNHFLTLDVELRIAGPLLVQSSEPGPWGVDAVCLRDSKGRLVIPGTELLGLYREALHRAGIGPFGRPESSSADGTDDADTVPSVMTDKRATGLMAEPRVEPPENSADGEGTASARSFRLAE